MEVPSKFSADKFSPEQIIRLLTDLDSGKLDEHEALLRHGVDPQQLAEWRRQYPYYRSLSPYHPSNRWVDVALGAGLLSMLAAYFLQDMDRRSQEQFALPLVVLFCLAILALIRSESKQGMVRIGRRGRVYRDRQPLIFWFVIALQSALTLSALGFVLSSTFFK